MSVSLLSFRPSDGEEGEEDDEELPERHEPRRQEGRSGQTRVRPQTQTSSGREEEVRNQRPQIKPCSSSSFFFLLSSSFFSLDSWTSVFILYISSSVDF